jgi:hypothetical protein
MKSLMVFVSCTATVMTSLAQEATPSLPTGARDFDFLIGDWRVHHHRQKLNSNEWMDFEGTASNRPLMNGTANLEEHALNMPTDAYRAVALRAYDAKTREWAIWWLDSRYPSGPISPAVVGHFENGVGRFYADDKLDGKPMVVRFIWSNITPTSARWEQAFSFDGGNTWATNWVMNFERADSPIATVGATEQPDFDFLHGNWRVHHRFLRVHDGKREWLDADGTAIHCELMGHRANMEEYVINAPSGTYCALALRSFDGKKSQWSIWWLDGRHPHGALDPPVRGRFENGFGTFYGRAALNGKQTQARFTWSDITPTSARWEQAYSSDEGKTWETNWIMDFQHAPNATTDD